jgi:riboflavin biosynthesis pyrimidine reductase
VAEPLELLLGTAGRAALDLPDELERLYGGPLSLATPLLYSNFVETLDGVVAIHDEPRSNRLVSGGSASDRFVMGLLRACADCVLLGSGTLHGSPRSLWTPERAYPDGAEAFAELRRRLGLRPVPALAVLTATGGLEPEHPALVEEALVLTTERGAERSHGRLPEAVEIVPLPGDTAVEAAAAVGFLRGRGYARILSEAGPHVFGALLDAGLVDEVFLTLAPLLAGRSELGRRLALVEGHELLPDRTEQARLVDARRDGSHLFLRYALSSAA